MNAQAPEDTFKRRECQYTLRNRRFKGTSGAFTSATQQEINNFDLKQRRNRDALRKVYDDPCQYRKFVVKLFKRPKMSKSHRSFLFRQAIQFGEISLAVDLCGHGVSRTDLKFFVSWFLRLCPTSYKKRFSAICKRLSVSGSKDEDWLKQYVIRLSMREYFKQKSYQSLKNFIFHFSRCRDKTVTDPLFRETVAKCVEFDLAKGFVELCKAQFTSKSAEYMDASEQEDCSFAYTCAITGNRAHFIQKVCKQKIGNRRTIVPAALQEVMILTDIVFEKEAWSILPVFVGQKMFTLYSFFELLAKCVQKMLSDQATWPVMAPTLNRWIREEWNDMTKDGVKFAQRTTVQEQWPVSLSSLKQWCVDTGHANLAFFLALVSDDWQFVETFVRTQASLDFFDCKLWGALELAAEKHAFSAGVAMLKLCPLGDGKAAAHSMEFPVANIVLLAKACEDEGLLDWALALMSRSRQWTYVEKHHRRCQNDFVLNFILQEAVCDKAWTVTRELVIRCTNTKILKFALWMAVRHGKETVIETVIGRVDPTTVLDHIWSPDLLKKTLLFTTVQSDCPPEAKMRIVCLYIASGVSTFERNLELEERKCDSRNFFPLLWALEHADLPMIELLLECGACSHRTLHKVRKQIEDELQHNLTGRSEEWKRGCACVLEAAATPCRLEHLARLATSHQIGSQPGRSERIEALPIPKPIQNMLRFQDIILAAAEKNLK